MDQRCRRKRAARLENGGTSGSLMDARVEVSLNGARSSVGVAAFRGHATGSGRYTLEDRSAVALFAGLNDSVAAKGFLGLDQAINSGGRTKVDLDQVFGARRQDLVVQFVAVVGELGHEEAAVDPLVLGSAFGVVLGIGVVFAAEAVHQFVDQV